MPITKSNLSQDERAKLVLHLQKHKVYPYRYRFRKLISAANFPTADGAIGSYFTMSFTPKEITGIVSLATSFIITPNTAVDIFALVVSYKSTITFADNAVATIPDDEGGDIYQLLSNGGAINDFQVFYPLNWYLERDKPIYMHVFAGALTVAGASTTITGHFILGTLPTGA